MTATGGNETQRLSSKQLRAVDLIASGSSDREVAEALAVDRVTIWRWRTQDATFRASLNTRRAELWETSRDRLRSLLPCAIEVIATALDSGDSHAALALLKLVGVGDVDLGRVGPVDPEVIVRIEEREQARREHEAADEKVRAAEQAEHLEMRRLLAGIQIS